MATTKRKSSAKKSGGIEDPPPGKITAAEPEKSAVMNRKRNAWRRLPRSAMILPRTKMNTPMKVIVIGYAT